MTFTVCSDCQTPFGCVARSRCRVGMAVHVITTPTGRNNFYENFMEASRREEADRRSRFEMKPDMTMRDASSRRSSPAFARMTNGVYILGIGREERSLRDMLLLCGEPELDGIDSPRAKLRALIDGLIVQRRRADGKVTAGAFTFSQGHDGMVRIEHETGETLVCESITFAGALARFWKDNF